MNWMDLFGDVSTADDGERSNFDFYETPRFMTLSLLYWHRAIRGCTVLEPCAGRGAIVNVLRENGCIVHSNDVDRRHRMNGFLHDSYEDATTDEYWRDAPSVEWVVTNPTFDGAIEIVKRAKLHATKGIAFLLRKTFTEPTRERGPWLMAHPPTRVIGQPRYQFRGNGSDMVSADWFIWERSRNWALPPFVVDDVAEARR